MCPAGLLQSRPDHPVTKHDQPPASTGCLLLRRCSIVPQSVATKSTFMPMLFIVSAATSAIAFSVT